MGSSASTATIAAVSPISIAVGPAWVIGSCDQREMERDALLGEGAAADLLDRRHHAALAIEQGVGETHDADVRRRGRRGAADRPGDLVLVALGLERACRDERCGGRA